MARRPPKSPTPRTPLSTGSIPGAHHEPGVSVLHVPAPGQWLHDEYEAEAAEHPEAAPRTSEEADVKHVVKTSPRRQGEADSDVVDQLDDAVGPVDFPLVSGEGAMPRRDWPAKEGKRVAVLDEHRAEPV